jgi:hypothetical protein
MTTITDKLVEYDAQAGAHVQALDVDAIARALRMARPDTTPGTYAPNMAQGVKGQRIGWRYAVCKVVDTLQATHGAAFDRAAFNSACGTDD